MKRTLAVIAALLLAAIQTGAQSGNQKTIPVLVGHDLDGAAAADTAIFADTNIADGASYTITNQPDACRALVATITDADTSIAAADATLTGTDGNGAVQTAAIALNGGSGTRAISGVWCSVISVTNGTLTGETAGTDKIRLGTTGAAPFQYNVQAGPPPPGFPVTTTNPDGNPADAFAPDSVEATYTPPSGSLIKTTAWGTAITSFVASSGALTSVANGDQIIVNDSSDRPFVFGIIAKADANNVTADRSISLEKTNGHGYRYRKLVERSGVYGGWFKVGGWRSMTIYIDVVQMTGTGGIDYTIECAPAYAPVSAGYAVVGTTNIAGASRVAGIPTSPWDVCRVGLKWATNDDADATAGAEERVSVWAILQD